MRCLAFSMRRDATGTVGLGVQTGTARWTWQVEGEVIADYTTIDNGRLAVATTRALYALNA